MTAVNQTNLRVPGPTSLPPEVLDALSTQMINHRGKSYEEIQKRVIENLQHFYQTENDIYLLTSSGMGGLEAAIVNFFSPGDLIVSFTIGEFGDRWAEIGRRFGAQVIQIKFTSGTAVTKEEVNRVLSSQKGIKGVLFTHNETATGVLNKISDFATLVKSHPDKPLLLVDSISALGAVDLPMDTLGIDVLISASQKAWMAPPGLAMIAVSQKGFERHKVSTMPRYYFDLTMYKEFALKNQTPATPAVATLFGLDVSLGLMKKEGRENIFERHLQLRDYLRSGLRKIGLKLFVSDSDASPTVTSIIIPDGIDGHEWLKVLREKYNAVLAGGMGDTKGKIIRVAHMGFVGRKNLDEVLTALERSMQEL